MRYAKTKYASAIVAVCLATSSVYAQEDPAKQPDDSWISLTGTVTSVDDDSFKLDYGKGLITVEMDDWDNFGEAYALIDGDQVTVYGEVDKDLYESAKIEADSVYLKDLNTFFYASDADEEEYGEWVLDVDADLGDLTYIGTVKSVNEVMNTFTIDTGTTKMTVDTSGLLYDPLDDEGFQQIEVGDRVSVDAEIDRDFIGDHELLAESIVTISE
ncbi:MAG: NirD/YgiW/YdeI family stress tolerance protein [Wenzhouxiangellaceae bacterium]|nr:NirD/YgiW/YdeI family stress tolerance protein [Wenzhouxiangellaceae bacterium]